MPNVQTLLAAEGLTFTNAFVTTPLCCPSRASILRGQYAHSHGVLNNVGENGGFPAFYRLGDEDSTVATWLHDAGYRTALIGKYLNRYPKGAAESHVPPGWDEWSAFASTDEETREGRTTAAMPSTRMARSSFTGSSHLTIQPTYSPPKRPISSLARPAPATPSSSI